MMATREELAEAERGAWAEFMALVGRVPRERRDVREVVPGWSVKDLVWHNAGWMLFSAEALAKLDGKPFVDPFSGHDDAHFAAENELQLEAGRRLSWDEVVDQAERQRARTHELWAGLGAVSDEAAAFFAEESTVHYEEHAEEIRRFLSP
ncbi:MAG: DinB family protein [Actinomycetota bacterium]